jgi:DNA polymerase III subunit delta
MNESIEKILSDIRLKIFKPVYLLTGEEPYYIDLISDAIENSVLSEEEKAFNQTVLYGEDATVPGIIESARRFPMMSNHQVIIVREAQMLKKIEDLAHYTDAPLNSTVLVINYKYKKIDKRTKLFKSVDKSGVVFTSEKLRDYQMPGWIGNYLMRKGIDIAPDAKNLITEYLGTDLGKVVNELDKLIISLNGKKPVITTDLIEKNIGISKDYNIFELQKAIGEKKREKIFRIVSYFADNPKDNPVQLSIASLFAYFSRLMLYHSLKDKSKNNVAASLKINPYFVKEYEIAAKRYSLNRVLKVISDLRTYDLKSKGVGNTGINEGELLKELVLRIVN